MIDLHTSGRKILSTAFPILLTAIFLLLSLISVASLHNLQGNARIINYTGIVRGATQRLIKKELAHMPDDALIADIGGIINELITGDGNNGLIVLQDRQYQALMAEMNASWEAIKLEISRVRTSGESHRLLEMSEDYFELANRTVAAAEDCTEARTRATWLQMIALNFVFIGLFVLFIIYNRRQRILSQDLALAEAASREKSDFLSRMSHEIRTPMNGIIGMTAIAKESLDNPERLLDCLDKIDLSSQFLLSLINDVLDMARIENGKMVLHKTTFDLPQIIDGIHTMLTQKAQDKGIDLQVDTQQLHVSMVIGDPLHLEQVVINLLSNAIKFTPEGGKVALKVRQTARDQDHVDVEFTILDNGIGMKKEFMQHMFEPFAQEQQTISRQYGGTGLGLSISYQLVCQMQGTLTVDSELGRGSCFVVSLPFGLASEQEAARQASPLPAAEQADFAGRRFLIAEDNEINAEIVMALLGGSGAVMDHVWNGREAVDTFARSAPGEYSLILMDVQMPGMDGLSAARAIRALDRWDAPTVPIIALTANAFVSDMNQSLDSGMTGYLSKPIVPSLLFQTLASTLRASAPGAQS